MRILLVTHYFEPDSGAAAVRLSRLAKLLRQRGHEITILTTLPSYPQGIIAEGYRNAWEVVEQRDGLCIIRTWLWATPSPRISRKLLSQMSFMLTASLRGLSIPRPDAVLIEAQPVFTSLAGVFFSQLKRVPYVLNVSDLWPDHLLSVGTLTAGHPVYRLARWLVNCTYHWASMVTAMSPAWADAIQTYIGEQQKIRVIYNGVDLERFRPGLDAAGFRQKYNLGSSQLVTFIGTFATQYDFETMLAAAAQFAPRQDVQFVFIGDGSQREWMSKANVRWIRWINHAEIPLAWSASSLTFWAMRDQGLYRGTIPAKMYEAMASGTPIVAAGEGIAADMINRCYAGLTVPPRDIDGLVNAISRLLDDEALRAQFSQSARAYAEQNFDPEKVADAYEDILISCVDTSPATSVR
jgi:glycosyltransferase involved in cell wall biosynthesis